MVFLLMSDSFGTQLIVFNWECVVGPSFLRGHDEHGSPNEKHPSTTSA